MVNDDANGTSTSGKQHTASPVTDLSKDKLLTADQWAANRKGPPNTAAVAMARVTVAEDLVNTDKDGDDELDDLSSLHDDATLDEDEDTEANVLTAAQVSTFKSMIKHTKYGAMAREALKKHNEAMAEKERKGFIAQADAVKTDGKTYAEVLILHERRLLTARQEAEESEKRKAAEVKARREQHDAAKEEFAERLRQAQLEVKKLEEKQKEEDRGWEAHYLQLDAKHAAKIATAEAAVVKAKEALKTAASPHDVVKLENDDGKQDTAMGEQGTGQPQQQQPTQQQQPPPPTQPLQLMRFAPTPQLVPPSDPALLQKLHEAKATLHLWSYQEVVLPLTPENLGLSLEQCAQLIGEDNWKRAACMAPDAPLPRSAIGLLQGALTQLEVNTAAARASQEVAAKALEERWAKRHKVTENEATVAEEAMDTTTTN